MDSLSFYINDCNGRLLIAVLALGLNALFWHTQRAGRFFATPQTYANRAVNALERRYNRVDLPLNTLRGEGISISIFLVFLALLAGIIIEQVVAKVPFGWLLPIFCLATLITQRRVIDAVRALSNALSRSLPEARATLTFFAAQETKDMEEKDVITAGIEFIAKEWVEGLIAPIGYYLLFGLPGLFAYRAIIIANKSVGRDTSYARSFGWVFVHAGRFLSWPFYRISALLIAVVALHRGPKSSIKSVKSAWESAAIHPYKSSGWIEGAITGALSIHLSKSRWHGKRRLKVEGGEKEALRLEPNVLISALKLLILSAAIIAIILALIYKLQPIRCFPLL